MSISIHIVVYLFILMLYYSCVLFVCDFTFLLFWVCYLRLFAYVFRPTLPILISV